MEWYSLHILQCISSFSVSISSLSILSLDSCELFQHFAEFTHTKAAMLPLSSLETRFRLYIDTIVSLVYCLHLLNMLNASWFWRISRGSEADPGGGLRGLQPSFGKFSNWSGYPCLSLFHAKNNILSYNVSSSKIDRYKKTVAIPLLDSLIIQMQGRFSDEDCQACHLLCVVPSIIVNKALRLDDEVEGMLFWRKIFHFSNPLEIRY